MKFVALPVGKGDAFYVVKEGCSVLVDGGMAVCYFPRLFQECTKAKGAGIVICTHNDADHACGILGFLQAGLGCDELWLPATWIETLQSLPSKPEEWDNALWRIADEAAKRYGETENPFEAYASELSRKAQDDVPQEPDEASESPDAQTVDRWLSETLDQLLGNYAELVEEEPWEISPWPVKYRLPIRPATLSSVRTYLQAWQATKRLLKIALAALHRGIKVRCFEFCRCPSISSKLPLIPLNSIQTRLIRSRPKQLPEALLALSVVNRESLCYQVPPDNSGRGVIFTADSDLANVTLPNHLDGTIVTAPHHGASDNKQVYQKIQQKVIWVRSDCHSTIRPCADYLEATGSQFCTLCRGGGHPKQAVRFYTRAGRWVRNRTAPCTCI